MQTMYLPEILDQVSAVKFYLQIKDGASVGLLFETKRSALLHQSYVSKQGDFSGLPKPTTKGKGIEFKTRLSWRR